MEKEFLEPWYAVKDERKRIPVYNRQQSATKLYAPPPEPLHPKPSHPETPKANPKPQQPTNPAPKIVYRSADVVFMEMTVKIRKDLAGEAPFEWPDDIYRTLCTSWYEEQKKKGIKDIAWLCGEEASNAMQAFTGCCMVCWYGNGNWKCFIPSQENRGGNIVPVIIHKRSLRLNYSKPVFTDNGEAFKKALKTIADFAPFAGWKKIFNDGLAIMERDDVTYCGQKETFNIPKPYFKYLYAAQVTQLGTGMGSWFDLPIMGTKDFKAVTDLFFVEQCKAKMYAINNC